MNIKTYGILAALVITVAGVVAYVAVIQPALYDRTIPVTVMATIAPTDVPISFQFPSGADALTLIEPPAPTEATAGPKKVFLLLDTGSYQTFSTTESDIAPPTISVFAFNYRSEEFDQDSTGRVDKLKAWAQQYPQFSSWPSIVGEVESVELDGVTALRYRTTTGYEQEVYVALYQKHMFVLTGQFETAGDEPQQRFADLIETVTFD